MAVESTFVYDKSFVAAQDLSAAQYYIVSSSAEDVVAICVASSGGGTGRAIGVVQNNPTSGNAANVRILGQSKVVASSSGTIAVGAYVGCSTGGLAVSATTGFLAIGTAMSATTGASGQIVEVLMRSFVYIAGATA